MAVAVVRRRPGRQQQGTVAAAGVERLALQSINVPDSCSLRHDLQALQHNAVQTFMWGRGRFIPQLIREVGHHAEITDLLYTVIHTRRQAYRRVLALAVARGQLAPTLDQELLIDLLIGPSGHGS